MKVAHDMVESHLDPIPFEEREAISADLPHVAPPKDVRGHWETHNPENPNLTPRSRIRIARVALAFTDRYPQGWDFETYAVDRKTKEKYGRVIYFVPDQKETEQ